MKTMIAGWTAAVLVFVSAASLRAHHSLSQFDTATAVRVKGVIVAFERVNPHSILFVDQEGPDGETERWAVEGPSTRRLDRLGVGREALTAGDVIEVCGYVMKDGVEFQRTISTQPVSPGQKTTNSLPGRLLVAEELVMPDGEKRPWEDYGFHECLGPDYVDVHVR